MKLHFVVLGLISACEPSNNTPPPPPGYDEKIFNHLDTAFTLVRIVCQCVRVCYDVYYNIYSHSLVVCVTLSWLHLPFSSVCWYWLSTIIQSGLSFCDCTVCYIFLLKQFSILCGYLASLHSLITLTFFCKYSPDDYPSRPELGIGVQVTLFLLGAIHLLLALWMVIEYFLTNLPHFKLPTIFFKAMYVNKLAIPKHNYLRCIVLGNTCLESCRKWINSASDS